MEKQLFNVWSNHTNNLGFDSIEQIYSKIKDGSYKKVIEIIRKSNNNELKKQLDGITFSANCGDNSRRTENIEEYTSFIILDFDKLINVKKTKDKIIQSEYTVMCFISPSGNGLKVLVKTNNYNSENHKSAYNQVQQYYKEFTNEKLDDNTKDAVRLCYFSYDSNAYLNLKAKEFTIENNKKDNVYSKSFDKIIKTVSFTNKKAQFKRGNRNKYMFLLATNCCKMGYNKDEVIEYCCFKYIEVDFEIDEIKRTINSAYQKNKDFFGVNDKYGRNKILNKKDDSNYLISINKNSINLKMDIDLSENGKDEAFDFLLNFIENYLDNKKIV
ncbi:BT4734/BF3469 family protein [Chishuiella sp.]|uniref:BT4734/BF3469 family protein n=1 Tax=Chishuiella sp. TaxID=1969467 RepID=UPI0028B0E126|nr:BT4734/BF3469 family protein [Chishuiella sp.]